MSQGSENIHATKSGTEVVRATERELVMRRFFRARPETVFDVMTKPELIQRWWAPRSLGVVMFECQSDPRVGGQYRYVFGRPGEEKLAFSGTYREVERGTRLVYTQIFEPLREAGEGLITATFEARDGGTQLVQRELYPSKEVLDGALASGMERGMRETIEQLEAVAVELDEAR